jgi:hypothetical protein
LLHKYVFRCFSSSGYRIEVATLLPSSSRLLILFPLLTNQWVIWLHIFIQKSSNLLESLLSICIRNINKISWILINLFEVLWFDFFELFRGILASLLISYLFFFRCFLKFFIKKLLCNLITLGEKSAALNLIDWIILIKITLTSRKNLSLCSSRLRYKVTWRGLVGSIEQTTVVIVFRKTICFRPVTIPINTLTHSFEVSFFLIVDIVRNSVRKYSASSLRSGYFSFQSLVGLLHNRIVNYFALFSIFPSWIISIIIEIHSLFG